MKRRDFIKASGITTAAAAMPMTDLFATVNRAVAASQHAEANYDVIVLGVGSMGSSTCYHLASQGVKVLGIEQFDIPHELGSHAGQSRMIRKAYAEHPDYVPLLQRAYANWHSLEAETGAELYVKTGILHIGEKNSPYIAGVRKSSSLYSIPVNDVSQREMAAKYPQFRIPDSYEIVFEPDAGFVTPERSVLLFTEQAIKKGATIHTKEKTVSWKREGSTITMTTNKQTYQCKKLVITAGPWAGKMIPGLSKNLKVTRQMIAWVNPRNWKAFELGNFPCWSIGDFYGFPILPTSRFGGPVGLKLAHHYHGIVSDPDNLNRIPSAEDESILVDFLNKFFPEGYASTHVMKTCMYTNTPDENFILDFLPGYDNDVCVAAGFSGHGFKFSSVVGEIMADLALKGNTTHPIGFLNATRF